MSYILVSGVHVFGELKLITGDDQVGERLFDRSENGSGFYQ